MQARQAITGLVCLVLLSACSAHSPLIVTNTTDVAPSTAAGYEPHGNPVWVTSEALPDTARHEVLGASSKSVGSGTAARTRHWCS